MRVRFVHAADLHLDSPMRGLRAPEHVQELLRGATFTALRRIVELCLSEKADFLVLAGDLFDARDRTVRARLALQSELRRLGPAGVQVFIVHGNHDPLTAESALGTGLPHVKVFGTSWEEAEVLREGRVIARVQGISYGQERVEEDLSVHYHRQGPELTVGLLHANVGGKSEHASYAPCGYEDLAARGLDYWALGHVHGHDERELAGNAVAVYPGNPQGRHAVELGPKGCVVVDVEDGQLSRRFVALDEVRWHRLQVPVEGLSSLEQLESRVEELVCDVTAACSDAVRAHVVRVELTGLGPLHRELAQAQKLAELAEHCEQALVERAVPVVLESLRDQTAAQLDVPGLRAAGGMAAEVLRLAEDPEVLAELAGDPVLRALSDSLRRVKLKDVPLGSEAQWQRATVRALELLVGEDA